MYGNSVGLKFVCKMSFVGVLRRLSSQRTTFLNKQYYLRRANLNAIERFYSKSSINWGESKIVEIAKDQSHDSNWIQIQFNDGRRQNFLSAWLRDNCKCKICWDDLHQFKMSDSWLPNVDISPQSYKLNENGQLEIIWMKKENETSHKSVYCSTWLQKCAELMSEKQFNVTKDVAKRPKQIYWTKTILKNTENIRPVIDFRQFMFTKIKVIEWLEIFHRFGFVVIKNAGCEDRAIEDFANRVAYISESSFGRISDVRIGPETNLHPAYSGLSIRFHTDLTYKLRTPGVLCLHCIKNSDPGQKEYGGQTNLVDAFQASLWIKENDQRAFKTLSTIPLPYSYTDPTTGICYHNYWPVIGLNPQGDIEEVHFSNFARQTLNFDENQIQSIYYALDLFAKRLYHSESVLEFYLEPGDILTINNQRVMHARTSFDPKKVLRHLRTVYMDLDEIYGLYDAILNKSDVKF